MDLVVYGYLTVVNTWQELGQFYMTGVDDADRDARATTLAGQIYGAVNAATAASGGGIYDGWKLEQINQPPREVATGS